MDVDLLRPSHSAHPERAKELIRRLTGFNAQPLLSAAGFEVGT